MENKASESKNTPDKEKFAPPKEVSKRGKINIDLTKIKTFLTSKPSKKQLIIIGGITAGLLTLTTTLVIALGNREPSPALEPIVKQEIVPKEIKPVTEASRLTGVQVSPELNKRPITGIMIENSIDARPQAGLTDAGVVFEAIAEGGITRFLALFQVGQPEYIGPIRSARPYYVQWAAGFRASYVHSGGSGEALNLIRSIGVKDMDHSNYPSYFDRVSNRYAPHNVYTSMERLDNLRGTLGFTTSKFEPFTRIEQPEPTKLKVKEKTETTPAEASKTLANKIEFNISSPLYNTSYSYNAETNTYARVQAGQPHLDERSGKQINPSVVVAMVTSFGPHPDGVHSQYTVVGSGKLVVFQNGEVLKGTWSKSSSTASLLFKDDKGKNMELQPGQTWITAIPDGRVSYTP